MKMTDEEILMILDLVEKSGFNELNIQSGDFNLTLVKEGHGSAAGVRVNPQEAAKEAAEEAAKEAEKLDQETAESTNEAAATAVDGVSAIRAPMIGTFYARPEPGAPPFVEPGALVEEDTTVCLIETMKVFTSVKAGLRGYIEDVSVENTQMVEYGQVLFRVRPV